MDRGTIQNRCSSIPKINFEKLVHLFGFIIRTRLQICFQLFSRMLNIMMFNLRFVLCDFETQAYLKHTSLEGVDGMYTGLYQSGS